MFKRKPKMNCLKCKSPLILIPELGWIHPLQPHFKGDDKCPHTKDGLSINKKERQRWVALYPTPRQEE